MGSKDFISCEGQLEIGEEGTPHLQLMLKTKSMKFSAVKKLFPRAHIEVATNPGGLQTYVHKPETRLATIATTQVATVATFNNSLTRYFETEDSVTEWVNNQLEGLDEQVVDKYRLTMGITLLDHIANLLIREGYYGVEYIASNPSVRSAWKLYYKSIVYRQYATPTQVPQGEPPPPPSEQSDESA